MKRNRGLVSLIVASVTLVSGAALADTITIEATETPTGKSGTTERMTLEVGRDQPAEVSWRIGADRAQIKLESVPARAGKTADRNLRVDIDLNGQDREIHLRTIVAAAVGKRMVIGNLSIRGRSVEIALIRSR